MSSVVLPCLGLAPDQHALAAPQGSMRHAENVVCDLPNIIRARPSFTLGTNKSTTYKPATMHVYGSTRIVVAKDGSNYRIESEAAAISGNADPVSFDDAETSFAEARKSLYYCTSTGVRALRTEAGTTTEAAGLDFQHLLSVLINTNMTTHAFQRDTTFFGPFSEPFSVAYSMVVKRTDANGYVRRSPPTNRFYVRKAAGAAVDDAVVMLAGPSSAGSACLFPTGTLAAGDVVEFYRTLTGAAQYSSLPASMFFVASYTITAADVTAGYFPPSQVQLVDRIEDTDLGEALYTNPERDGALNAKRPPPIAQEIASWQSCMWFGRTKTRHRLVLTLVNAGDSSGGGSTNPTAESIGFRTTSGDYTNGSNQITNVVNVTGVAIGAYVDSNNPFIAGGFFPLGTKVTAISGAGPFTVTASANATATSVGAIVKFGDVITIDGVDFVAWDGEVQTPVTDALRTFPVTVTDPTLMSTRVDQAATFLAAAVNNYAYYHLAFVGSSAVTAQTVPGGSGSGQGNTGSLILERTNLTGASFVVKSTKPLAWRPSIGDDPTDTLSSTQEDRPNRVYFSLPNEPEAVPLLNYIDVGSELAPIQRLVPLTDALLVFKTDGLYRITGSAPDNWSLTQIDPELRLVRPEAVSVLGNIAYAWTERGVVAIDESGVRAVISAGKIDTELFTPQGAILANSQYHGCRVLVSKRHHLVLVTMPNTTFSAPRLFSDTVYVYAVKTGQWTKWPLRIRCGATGSDGVLWIAANNGLDELEWETRYLLDTPRGYDRSYTLGAGSGAPSAWTETASSTAMSITNAQRSEWVPTVGDWVFWTIGTTEWRRIIAVSVLGGGDYSWTLDAAAPSNIASATAKGVVVGTPVLMEWLPSVAGNGGVMLPVWRGLTFSIEGAADAKASPTDFRVTFNVKHDGSDDSSLAQIVGTPLRSSVQLRPYRFGWPRNGSRRADVGPRLAWSEIDWPWRLSGVALIGEAGSERVRK